MQYSKKYPKYIAISFGGLLLVLLLAISAEYYLYVIYPFYPAFLLVIQSVFVILVSIYAKKNGISIWWHLFSCAIEILLFHVLQYVYNILFFTEFAKFHYDNIAFPLPEYMIGSATYILISMLFPFAMLIGYTIFSTIKQKYLYPSIVASILILFVLFFAVIVTVVKMNPLFSAPLYMALFAVIQAPFGIIMPIYARKNGINKWVNFAVCGGVMLLSSIAYGISVDCLLRGDPLGYPAYSFALLFIGVSFSFAFVLLVLSTIFTPVLEARINKKLAEKSKG